MMRAQAEWNVHTHIQPEAGPSRPATRSFISPAALLVKVMAKVCCGRTWPLCMR